MNPDILIVRDDDGYRLLHGHLHLASQLSQHGEIEIDMRDEGSIKIWRTHRGYVASTNGQQLPLLPC